VDWTPVQVYLEPDGTERHRTMGFVPVEEMLGQIALALAKSEFGREKFKEAEKSFRKLVDRYPGTVAAPEALYWAAVSAHRRTGLPESLHSGTLALREQYPESEWTKKASEWPGEESSDVRP
jgi:TolA-binding protein